MKSNNRSARDGVRKSNYKQLEMWKMVAVNVFLWRKLFFRPIDGKRMVSCIFYTFVPNIHNIFDKRNKKNTIRLTKHAVYHHPPFRFSSFALFKHPTTTKEEKTKINKFFSWPPLLQHRYTGLCRYVSDCGIMFSVMHVCRNTWIKLKYINFQKRWLNKTELLKSECHKTRAAMATKQ